MGASHWLAKAKGVMKVKTGLSQLICDLCTCAWRNIVPLHLHRQWGGDRACLLGPERG